MRRSSPPAVRCRYVAMYCSASSAAASLTTAASEPSKNTIACRAASRSGWMPSSSGMSGKTAAPSGTSDVGSPADMSASCDGRDDAQLVAVLDRRLQAVEVANVLVVELDVH